MPSASSRRAKTTGQTGVEMEALTAASVAALTIYDMIKAVDKGAVIESRPSAREVRRQERRLSLRRAAAKAGLSLRRNAIARAARRR